MLNSLSIVVVVTLANLMARNCPTCSTDECANPGMTHSGTDKSAAAGTYTGFRKTSTGDGNRFSTFNDRVRLADMPGKPRKGQSDSAPAEGKGKNMTRRNGVTRILQR